jgi:hypothetical protein
MEATLAQEREAVAKWRGIAREQATRCANETARADALAAELVQARGGAGAAGAAEGGGGSEVISLDAETCAQLRAQVRALQQEVAVMRKAEEERERINAVLSVMQEEGWQ